MNKEYWEKFYKKRHINEPSDFARFVVDYFKSKDLSFYDLGCGNGRDTYYLGKYFPFVMGYDVAIEPKQDFHKNSTAHFIKKDISEFIECETCPDVVYSRFFIHSIDDELVGRIIKWTKGYFVAECRSVGDNPKLYKDHKRNFVNGNNLLRTLIYNGFEILHYEKSRGLAKYKNEDPLIIRIIARKY